MIAPRIAARTVALFALGAAMLAALIAQQDGHEDESPSETAAQTSTEAPATELTRCRDLGTAALEDEDCRAAWAENRRRFLGGSGTEVAQPDGYQAVPSTPLSGSNPKTPAAEDSSAGIRCQPIPLSDRLPETQQDGAGTSPAGDAAP